MAILDFSLSLDVSRDDLLEERDEIIDLLKSRGYLLVMTSDGTRILMHREKRRGKTDHG